MLTGFQRDYLEPFVGMIQNLHIVFVFLSYQRQQSLDEQRMQVYSPTAEASSALVRVETEVSSSRTCNTVTSRAF